MYQISDQQIDFILDDISARGVEMESLQQNLLDHVCCIIENNLEANGDFESFYQRTIKTFYKDELWEIEEETLQLLIFKNYYTMKKVMIISGIFSAAAMSIGILFKFMHWPGAALGIQLGIATSCFIFLPLLFTLKAKEKQNTKDKVLIGLATLCGIIISLAILFKIMHWPGATIMGIIFVCIMLLLYVPVYFFSGIRNPDAKINTITTTISIIMGCGLFLTLANSRPIIQERSNEISNQSLQDSYISISDQNSSLLASLATDSSADENTGSLNLSCNNLCNKIENLKLLLINTSEGCNITSINYAELSKLDNYDITTDILFRNHEPVAKEELLKLKEDLKAINASLKRNGIIDLSDKIDPRTGGMATWEVTNFYHTPLINVLRNLTQLQLNIRYIQLNNIK